MDLYTHPGKLGDALWALATARSHASGRKFDFALSPYCAPLLPLLQAQEYISTAYVLDGWNVKFDSPVTPAVPPWYRKGYTNVFHLGMTDWPSPTLAQHYPNHMMQTYGQAVTPAFDTPWLVAPAYGGDVADIVLSFSDEWAELKAGWILALLQAFPKQLFILAVAEGSRLAKEFLFPYQLTITTRGLSGLATSIASAKLVITCNSVGHPLASALGVRALVAECSPPRQQPVFKAPIARNRYWDGINSYELIDHVKEMLK